MLYVRKRVSRQRFIVVILQHLMDRMMDGSVHSCACPSALWTCLDSIYSIDSMTFQSIHSLFAMRCDSKIHSLIEKAVNRQLHTLKPNLNLNPLNTQSILILALVLYSPSGCSSLNVLELILDYLIDNCDCR